MDFLGIGPLELIAILLILFIVMGPADLVKMGATLGRALRNLRQSDTWKTVQKATRDLRTIPDSLVRQANFDDLEEIRDEIKRDLEVPKEQIEDLDRQFVAWTRETKAKSLDRERQSKEDNGDKKKKSEQEKS